jgi:hypothetical protein
MRSYRRKDEIMPVAYFTRALIQGAMTHAGAKDAPRGFNGSWQTKYDRNTGHPEQWFTIEERVLDDATGKLKVTGYHNFVAKGDLIDQIAAFQWAEVELVAEYHQNRETKYTWFELVEVRPVGEQAGK